MDFFHWWWFEPQLGLNTRGKRPKPVLPKPGNHWFREMRSPLIGCLEHVLFSHICIGNNHPNWPIFLEWDETTNQQSIFHQNDQRVSPKIVPTYPMKSPFISRYSRVAEQFDPGRSGLKDLGRLVSTTHGWFSGSRWNQSDVPPACALSSTTSSCLFKCEAQLGQGDEWWLFPGF